jgi:uncharacterized protein YhaN
MAMKKKHLIIKTLQIDKMPGFPNGLPPFSQLSEHINIISGPNASGKTSTARMIKTALWPENMSSGLYLDCKMQVDKELWSVKIESGKTLSTRNGNPDSFSELPPSSSQSRYFLSLHELIKSEDKHLAEQIIKESSGGYDLSKAAQKLNYSDSFSRSTINERKAYDEINAKYQQLIQNQAQLKQEEASLSLLSSKRDDAKKAKDFIGLYKIKSEHLNLLSQYETAKAKFEQFPHNLAKLNDSDFEQLQTLESEEKSIRTNMQKAETLIHSAKQKLNELNIPENGISDALISEWEIRIENIKDLNRKIELAETRLQNAKIAANEALKQLDPQSDSEKWKGLNLNQIEDIEKFIVEASQLSIEANSLKHEIESLSEEIESTTQYDVQKIQLGISVLSDWLKAQSAGESTKLNKIRWLGITGIITALTTFLLSYLLGILGVIPLLLGIFALIFIASRPSKTTRFNSDGFVSDFARTGLEAPLNWTSENVVERLKLLEDQLIKSLSAQEKQNELQRQKANRKKLEPKLEHLNKIRSDLKEKLGAFPEIPDGEITNFASPGWFFVNAKRWQEAHQQVLEINVELVNIKNQLENEKSNIQTDFTAYNFPESIDEASFSARLKDIKSQENVRKESDNIIRENERRIATDQTQLKTLKNKQHAIYDRLEVEHGQIGIVKNLHKELPEYQLAQKTVSETKLLLSEKEKDLKNHSLYPEIESDITYDQIDTKIQIYQEQANQYDDLVNRIASIREQIKQAGNKQELQKTLAEQDTATENLQAKYEENLSAITGYLLLESLREETRETQYPEVFKKAESHFVRITGGKYKLDISNHDNKMAFRAFDVSNQDFLQLDQLSSGTRIQLLLSVRLAFIEQQERLVSLPLIVDELLANSDDIRARAIIDALIDISENGRQIFYFTAQDDELAKWKTHLREIQLPANYIRLGKEAEKTDVTETLSMPEFINNDLPNPATMSHAEYGQAIGVQPFNPLRDNASQLHLWYLINSPDLLYNCLKKNIRELGALRTYLQNGGKIPNAPKPFKSFIEDSYKMIKQFISLYRVGRSIPIDRQVLEEADAVTDTYVDRVNEVLKSVNGNPYSLLEALKNGAVSGFRTKKAEELEQYLKDGKFLSDEQPLSDEEIRLRLLAFIDGLSLSSEDLSKLFKHLVAETKNQ